MTYNILSEMEKAMEKAVNYTDEMTDELVKQYTAAPNRETVESLANEFNKSFRSVVAKLSREGVYITEPRKAKDGSPVIRKEQLVDVIESRLDVAAPSLIKATKEDLKVLVEALDWFWNDQSTEEDAA